jgi:NAD(P)-dependent dehydrogenase (short-subunit alcohol dehydrogenase family)
MPPHTAVMQTLKGKIAIVGGASRGGGRGIALALGDAGATVYVAARTARGGPKPSDNAPGTVEDTAEEVTRRGGVGVPVRVDLGDEQQAAALFARVEEKHGRLDLLANSAWGANFMPVWSKRFWDLPPDLWRDTQNTVATYWLTGVHAARIMAKQGRGLIVFVTDNYPADPSKYREQILHDLGHESINRLVTGMSKGGKKRGITVAGLNSGFMQTERVLMHMKTEAIKKQFRFHLSESVEFLGRAVAALLADDNVARHNGKLLWASELAETYGFTDIDGRIPRFDFTPPENMSFD